MAPCSALTETRLLVRPNRIGTIGEGATVQIARDSTPGAYLSDRTADVRAHVLVGVEGALDLVPGRTGTCGALG